MMDKHVKTKWIKALRSGDYKQTKATLRDTEGFCCLGVLCDIYHKEIGNGKWVDWDIGGSKRQHFNINDIDGKLLQKGVGVPPLDVIRWCTLSGNNPIVKTSVMSPIPDRGIIVRDTTIAGLNDGGKTFLEIADIIEEQL